MFETKIQFKGSLLYALQNFCSTIARWSKDNEHAESLRLAVADQYRRGFNPSLRVFTAMRWLVRCSYCNLVSVKSGVYPRPIQVLSSKGYYFLEWADDNFRVVLTVPRSPAEPFRAHIKGEANSVRSAAIEFGVFDCKVETSGDTLLNMEEFVGLNWNDVAKGVKVPYWEWLALLRRYNQK
jgi:hypothetical protein